MFMSETTRVGFIGLGLMGAAMAANILRQGFSGDRSGAP